MEGFPWPGPAIVFVTLKLPRVPPSLELPVEHRAPGIRDGGQAGVSVAGRRDSASTNSTWRGALCRLAGGWGALGPTCDMLGTAHPGESALRASGGRTGCSRWTRWGRRRAARGGLRPQVGSSLRGGQPDVKLSENSERKPPETRARAVVRSSSSATCESKEVPACSPVTPSTRSA